MKAKISLVAIVMAGFILFGACGSTGSLGSNTSSPAYVSGSSFGSSLLGLYTQYKQTGKIDFKNTNTLLQLVQLATSCNTIKENLNDKNFYGTFVQGAVLGSQQKVTTNNAGGIINALTGLNFGNIAQAATGGGSVNATTVNNVTNTLTSLFSLFGK